MSDLNAVRRAARKALLAETGTEAPKWRQVHTDVCEEPDAIGPVCTDEGHDADDPSAYGCCPEPVIEVESPAIGAYLVALLNADREGGAA
ncbi:hypothetical protein CP973_07095 [Streptomyces albofaciens JCM 4342]|uniref:hypothetical protein n=1 Tax=Streptomyces albofaciens TaxID=66866 RepID=UPI001239D306|nr:hypothetical protein [Streptomyces albofaciens]KAA6221761.1 hypothetical protein CP973_07095 [Streptomyces albofaciens JCM 4342]